MKKIFLLGLSLLLSSNLVLAQGMKCNFAKYEEQSLKFIKKNDFKSHIELTSACIALKPNLENLYNNRANSYKRIGDLDNALKDYNKALELNKNYSTAYIGRANLKVLERKFDESIKDFNKAAELDPTNSLIYTNRANVKLMNKNFQGAIKDYKTAEELGANENEIDYNIQLVKYLRTHPEDIEKIIPEPISQNEIEQTQQQYSKEEEKIVEDSMFLYGFVAENATSLENFCKSSGYIPKTYLNLFNQNFKKTIAHMNSLFAKMSPNLKKELDTLKQEGLLEFENSIIKSYEGIRAQKRKEGENFTKQQYCKAFDDNAAQIVKAKVLILKKEEPSLYFDK